MIYAYSEINGLRNSRVDGINSGMSLCLKVGQRYCQHLEREREEENRREEERSRVNPLLLGVFVGLDL